MTRESVTISIVTAVLNGADTIRDCIESVLRQDRGSELIIVDGGSTDGTLDIIKEYDRAISRVVSESDRSHYDALNKGIALATGDVVGTLNADDFYAQSRVLSVVAGVFHHHRVDSCYSDLAYVNRVDPGRIIRYWKSCPYDRRLFYRGWMPPHPTFFVRRSMYEKYGGFRLDQGTASDYELMLRFLLKHEISSFYVPDLLVKMRTGGKSGLSLRSRLRAHWNDRRGWKVNGLQPMPWTLVLKPISKIPQYVFPRKRLPLGRRIAGLRGAI